MRDFKLFKWKGAQYRISSPHTSLIIDTIKKERAILESYILRQPEFRTSLVPITLLDDAPPIAVAMGKAADETGVGPMAAVAGAIAHAAASSAHAVDAAAEAIVENGGDIYLVSDNPILVGIYPGKGKIGDSLAFAVTPKRMPLSICSSSSFMGHSLSFGKCDLATVTSRDGALADAAATLVCNSVKQIEDIGPVLEKAIRIRGVLGVLIIKDDRIGMIGELPEIVKNKDTELIHKIPHDPAWKL